MSSDKRSIKFWVAIRPDRRKMLVWCPNKLNDVSWLDILNNNADRLHFPKPIFRQDNAPVQISMTIDNCRAKEWEVVETLTYSPNLDPIESWWGFGSSDYGKRQFCWEKIEWKNVRSVQQNWRRYHQKPDGKLYKTSARR